MGFKIQIKYLNDPRIYVLFSLWKVDNALDYYRFLDTTFSKWEPRRQEFLKHLNIRDALIQATSYRSDRDSQLASQRGDFEYFLIDGYKVTNLNFLKFI